MVAVSHVNKCELFKKISIIGLLMDYESNNVVKVLKATSDYITGRTTLLESNCDVPIDEILARINALDDLWKTASTQ